MAACGPSAVFGWNKVSCHVAPACCPCGIWWGIAFPRLHCHVLVAPKRFDFQGSRFCLLLCRKFCTQSWAVGFAQAERARWRWHSWTRRSPRRPPIMTKPSDHHRGLMRGPGRHQSGERTRTGSIDTTQTRIEAQLHRKKNETPRNQTRASWQMAVHARQKHGLRFRSPP